jgi:Cytochrome c3
LTGAHAKVACATCHVGERYKDLPRTCAACHAIQDAHRGRYGSKCETCHGAVAWKPAHFDHAKSTKFPLQGGHANAKCDSCHTGDLYRDKLQVACVACHKKDDPHKGQLGARCAQCHNETGWRQKVAFDHDLTRFPLAGLHATVPCEECHRTPSFKDAPRTCASCHKDSHHEGRLGANCALCHNPNGWVRWRFDHDKQTRFALTGAHKGVQCEACHRDKNVAKIALEKTCYGCHVADDVHQGSFGRTCEKCHSTATFKQGSVR